MATFKYRAKALDGQIQAGLIEAEDVASANQALEERGFAPLLIEPYKGMAAASQNIFAFLNRIKSKDMVAAVRALSVMVSASVPITEAVHNIARQSENPVLQRVLNEIASEIEGGARLSDALAHHPKVFSAFFINMVRSGETSGQLSETLEYLADQQEKDFDLMSKIKGAMIYPAFIVFAMVIVGFVMMTFVVPKLVQVLAEAQVALPITTRMLIWTSSFFQSFWWLIILATIGAAIAFRAYINTKPGRFQWDRVKLYIPIFGKLFREVYVVRFTRSLATLLHGGVDLVDALEIVSLVIGNEVWKRAVLETIREVNDGNSIITAFQRYSVVPTMMTQMLTVGEGTGRTQDILLRVSAFYAREIDNMVGNLTKLIEPVILLVLGAGVAVLVSAILLPLYSLSGGN
ncbi:MAG: type II secretion system F family protein [Patescibacteria group bacterium]